LACFFAACFLACFFAACFFAGFAVVAAVEADAVARKDRTCGAGVETGGAATGPV
jgi:hypothetical protein